VQRILSGFERHGSRLPKMEIISHYSYIALRPEGKLGPMHPERVERYDEQFRRLAEQVRTS
jgi:hypothetical protein